MSELAAERVPAAEGFRVLIVCSGNVCRSPFAELMLRAVLVDRPDIEVTSAGTIAIEGQPMTPEMRTVAGQHGVPVAAIDAHASRPLTVDRVAAADLVLGLTRQHRSAAVELFPRAVHYSFTLSEFARLAPGPDGADGVPGDLAGLVRDAALRRGGMQPVDPALDDITDPMGRGREDYARVGVAIVNAVGDIGAVLRTSAPSPSRPLDEVDNGNPSPIDLSFSFPRL